MLKTDQSHLSATDRGQATITDIRAMRLDSGFCLIRVDTDAGVSGYGECGDLDGDLVRAAIHTHAKGGGAAAASAARSARIRSISACTTTTCSTPTGSGRRT